MSSSWNDIVYTVTVIDLCTDPPLGLRRTPAIYTRFKDAVFALRNNCHDISDGGLYRFAVIEETMLNVVRPNLEHNTTCWWFKYNGATDEYEPICSPPRFRKMSGFGIG